MLFYGFYLSFIFVTVGLLFSILAYNRKLPVFFFLGIGSLLISSIWIVKEYEYYWYSLTENPDLLILVITAAYVTSIVFLILSKSTKKNADDTVTDAFLDDIINADDEEWDAES